jgi:hypothetical protein
MIPRAMNTRWCWRCVGPALLVVALVVLSTAAGALAQQQIQVDGTVQWVSGQTLMLVSDVPGPTSYQIVGQSLVAVPGARPWVNVDLRQLGQSDYMYIQTGDRVSVMGTITSDGRRLVATAIVRGAGSQAP